MVLGVCFVRNPRKGSTLRKRWAETGSAPYSARHEGNGRRAFQQSGQHYWANHAVPPARRCLNWRCLGSAWAKDLLVETQGNWGNLLTGDGAAAPRYIEARLSKFALDVVFNPKTTNWQLAYDGRKREPVTLPVKFPLLLAQGVEGIAVGLSSKLLPHNFNELIDAAIAYLKGNDFEIFPDFPTGGYIDVSRYNDGQRGGNVRVRAKIEKIDSKTLVINEVPLVVPPRR
jgi:DNA gyrase/topoisomerase IV subunit A